GGTPKFKPTTQSESNKNPGQEKPGLKFACADARAPYKPSPANSSRLFGCSQTKTPARRLGLTGVPCETKWLGGDFNLTRNSIPLLSGSQTKTPARTLVLTRGHGGNRK